MKKKLGIILMAFGSLAFSAGAYLFALGGDDMALGIINEYRLEGEYVQGFHYQDLAAFRDGLKETFMASPDIRRLHFECPDGSEAFTVYNTKLGIVGLPSGEVTCADGFKLLKLNSDGWKLN